MHGTLRVKFSLVFSYFFLILSALWFDFSELSLFQTIFLAPWKYKKFIDYVNPTANCICQTQ